MAIQTTLSQVEALYIGYFGRAGEPDGTQYWIDQLNGGHYSWAEAAASFSVQPEAIAMYPYLATPDLVSPKTFVEQVYLNLFGRMPDEEGLAYWTKELLARGNDPQAVGQFILDVINGAFGPEGNPADAATVTNKIEAATYFTEALAAQHIGGTHVVDGKVVLDDNLKGPSKDAVKNVTDDPATVAESEAQTDAFIKSPESNPGEIFNLTPGIDTVLGTAKNDTINAIEVTNALGITQATLTDMDNIDGGDGIDTLNVVQTGSINTTTITGLKVTNVEIVNMTSGAAVRTNTTAWTGATELNINAGTAIDATAAATTDVVAASAKLAGLQAKVSGGHNVSLTTNGVTSGTASVTNAAGNVNVVHNAATFANGGNVNLGGVTVTGGKSIHVTETSGAAAATKGATNYTVTQGDISVTGGATTTDVTVTQDKAVAAVNGTDAAGRVGVANATVVVRDSKWASNTDVGTIETVTLNSYGDGSSVASGALKSVNLSGTGGTLDINSALTKNPTNSSFGINANDLAGGAIFLKGASYKTLNIDSSGAKSTIANVTAAGATAVNISGDALLTLTAQTFANAKTITSTNTAGVSLGTQLNNDVLFTGGAGNDTITINATTKAIKMGAGNDTVILKSATLGAGGSVDGGEGTDTLVVAFNGTTAFSADPAFSGFEILRVDGGSGTHNAHNFTGLEVGALTNATTFTAVAAGVDLTVLNTTGQATTVTLANATGTSDVFNLHLKSAAAIDANTINLAGIETVNITNTDTNTTAHQNTLKLVATSATSITVSGNAGLLLDSSGNTKVTNFDASGVQGAAADKVALGVSYTSANNQVGAHVTITGGSGNDVLKGTANANDIINGGAGDDLLIYNGGKDVFTGGSGADTFKLDGRGTKTDFLTITDAEKSDKIDLTHSSVSNGNSQFTNTKLTLGADATFDQYLDAAASGSGLINSKVSWFEYGGDTFVYVDNSITSSYSALDAIIKLSGVVDLSTSTMASNVLTIA